MMLILIKGVASVSALILGVRLYKVYFSWGSYEDMVRKKISNCDKSKHNLLDKTTVVITGANSGIGKETARVLYQHGARVILACRNRDETQAMIEEFKRSIQSSGELVYRHLDLASLESVKNFASKVIKEEPELNMLINNAAVFGAPIQSTEDGFEMNMQVNHLAPALLTVLLLPKLQSVPPTSSSPVKSRIVLVTSTLYKKGLIKDKFFEKMNATQISKLKGWNQSGEMVYASTKLANLLFIRHLSSRSDMLHDVEICLASPGFTLTKLHRYIRRSRLVAMSLLAPLLLMIMKSPSQGAQTIIGCAMTSKVRSDVLYQNCRTSEAHFQTGPASDSSLARNVFEHTMNSIKQYLY